MKKVRFQKGKERAFLQEVLEKINCPSLRELINRGFDVPYSTLKNYYNESRLLPENLFLELCDLAKIDETKLNVEHLDKNWGQSKGGKISKRNV